MTSYDEQSEQQSPVRGFIYLLSNLAIPHHVKIGQSRISPFDRAENLYTTGVPEPFKVERAWYVENPYSVEQEVHALLANTRSSGGNREFFEVSIAEAISNIEDVVSTKLVQEVYFSSESSLAKLNSALRIEDQLKKTISSLSDQLTSEQQKNMSISSRMKTLDEKLVRYTEAYEKIGMVDKIIEERNRYRDRYQAATNQAMAYAMEYEKFLLNLGGRYAFWAEEQAKKRPQL
ncbi:GIY-YIG nuclease family protein [Pseudomonas sp. ES4]|uniref:GIY-YIG nuclease family protein n=1 Tax=Pseudomonas sp. ES4 TaxID=3424777 RepID=UPI003D338616